MWSPDNGKTLYDGLGVPLKHPKDVREVYLYRLPSKTEYYDFKSKGGKTEDEAGVLAYVDDELLQSISKK